MCNTVTILRSREDAEHEIEVALSQGDVGCALANAQCLWALCTDEPEFSQCLEGILDLARRFRTRLAPAAQSRLSWGLSEVRMNYFEITKEHLLAGSVA